MRLLRSLALSRVEAGLDERLRLNAGCSMLVGVAVKSISISAAWAVPVVVMELLSLRQVFPFTLGTNVGMTSPPTGGAFPPETWLPRGAAGAPAVQHVWECLGMAVSLVRDQPVGRLRIWPTRRWATAGSHSSTWRRFSSDSGCCPSWRYGETGGVPATWVADDQGE